MAKKFNPKRKFKKNRQSTFKVTEDTELLVFLLATIKEKSRNKMKSMLTHKQFKVGKEIITKHSHPLKPGDEVTVKVKHTDLERKHLDFSLVIE